MQLRQYQIDNANILTEIIKKYRIAAFVAEMRVGKTLTSLQVAFLLSKKNVLFVTKKKAISSIENDYKNFNYKYKLTVTNYEQLHNLKDEFDFIICDECHSLGQYPLPSNRAINLKKISVNKDVLLLSGTISPESYSQLFHQFWISSFGPWNQFKNFYAWHKFYGIPSVKFLYNKQINDYSKTKKELIFSDFDKYMISFSQVDAGFEMFVEEEILKVPMSEKIQKAITILRRDKVFTTKAGMTILADTAVKEMQKVHQLCGGTVKAECGTGIVFDTTKVDFIVNHFKGQKIAIFYKYIAEGIALRDAFKGRVYDDPTEFNKADNEAVFICQVQSGREGINVSTADCLVMYNIDFSALSYWQSRARLQTKNRVKKAMVYWIFTDGGIEEKIYQMVLNKKDFTTVYYKKSNF